MGGGNGIDDTKNRYGKLSKECKDIRSEVWKNLKEWLKDRCQEKKKRLIECKHKLKQIVKNESPRWTQGWWDAISKTKDISEWWRAINSFRVAKRRKVTSDITDEQWVRHFENLLKVGLLDEGIIDEMIRPWEDEMTGSTTTSEDQALDRLFSVDEIKTAVNRMCNGKAMGEDGIPIECIKILCSEDLNLVTIVLNKIWDDGKLPRGWEKARIVPIFKNRDVNDTGNYIGISLLNVGYKILTNVLANRLNC